MLDHLLRMLKERSAVPSMADRRQYSAGGWSPSHVEQRTRVVATLAQAGASPGRQRAVTTAFQLPYSQSIQRCDADTSVEKPEGGTRPSPPRSGLPNWPAQCFAPYVDLAAHPMYDITADARREGIRFFTLAFVTADPRNRPAWGGYVDYAVGESVWDKRIEQQIEAVRAAGGDVMVSFGGAAGTELAGQIEDVAALTAAYRRVIETHRLTHIDFDIEGAAQRDRASIDRRSQAIAALQREATADNRSLAVWFTLPILPTGLTPDGLRSVQSAIEHGVAIAGVNGMAMEFGDCNAPNPTGKMGDYAIQSGKSLFQQLKALVGTGKHDAELWSLVGITPRIGRNNLPSEVFTQSDARQLTAWASRQGAGRLSMWSLNRDQPIPAGTSDRVKARSSGLEQTPLEFSRIFGVIHK